MSSYKVLISCPLLQDTITEYAELFEERDVAYDVPEVAQQLTEDELLDIIDRYDGVLIGDDEMTESVIAAADRLQVISKWGIGTDNIDKTAAAEHGVTVHNTPGTLNEEVATVVIGYAVLLTRHLHSIDQAIRGGDWYSPRGVSLHDKTFGVIGVGDIGSTVARRAHGMGMTVLGTDVEPLPDDLVAETGIESCDLTTLLTEADLVSINCNLNEGTRELIGREELEHLGPEGYLINTARGEIVDQDALVTALQDGTIAGAALDVFETEPLPADHPLTELENVVLGSHNAQNTEEAVKRVTDLAIDNLLTELS